jgi:predicted phage terminase large subunit-like protein
MTMLDGPATGAVEFALATWVPQPRRYPTPGEVARKLDPANADSAALRYVDSALVDLVDGNDYDALAVFMPPQEGKLVADDTPVPTPSGWARHGDLRPGDTVFHPSGRPVRVTAISEPAQATLRVRTSDHGELLVHPRHEWLVYDRSHRQWRRMETQQIARRHLEAVHNGKRHYVFQLPHSHPLELPDAVLPVDPRTLGLWLGDGSSTKAAITHHPADRYLTAYPESARCVHHGTGIITTYYRGGMKADLRAAGVLGNKHIPPAYLRASEKQRRALLSGLIDTDGHVSASGQVSFDGANERLVRDTAELIRTLGYRAHVHRPTAPKLSSSGIQGVQQMWRVTYTPHDEGPARLDRKAAVRLGRRRRVAITAIEPSGPAPGHCISVESPDGLYLVGEHFTPTHNSQRCSRRFPEWLLDHNPALRIAIVSYELDLAARWGRDIKHDISAAPLCTRAKGAAACDDPACRSLHIPIRQDSRAAARWETPMGGGIYCVGIGGALTGRPVDCLRGDTEIVTDSGYACIRDIHQAARKPRVLSYNHTTGRTEWKPVTASRAIPQRKLIEIVSASGRRITCTPDHRIATEAGYKPAQELAPGDRLIALHGVRSGIHGPGIRAREETTAGTGPVLLLAGVRGGRAAWRGAPVPAMRKSDRIERSRPPLLLTGVQGGSRTGPASAGVPAMRGYVHPQEQAHGSLFPRLRQRDALATNDRRGKLALQGRLQLRRMVPADAPADQRARPAVPGMHETGPDRSPHQPPAIRLPAREPDSALRGLPHGAPQVEADTVSMVRELRGERDTVYDLQVEGNHNFFAGQILVHNCLIIDDPVKDRAAAESKTIRDTTWDWWENVALTRLAPGAKAVLIQCMTGDTPVLMGDGVEKPLRDVRPGDVVATYEHGAVTTAVVRNWANQGRDTVYEIRMKSGATVRANARHPFLTLAEDGAEVWRRTDMLRPGDRILRATGANGAESPAPWTSATSPPRPRAGACPTTTKPDGQRESARRPPTPNRGEPRTSSIATASARQSTTGSWPRKMDSARYAEKRPARDVPNLTTSNSALTTTTRPGEYAGCSVTAATSRSGTPEPPRSSGQPLSTWSVAPDEVTEVVTAGVEDVFDLQVDRTENFIANGLTSHNTRWHEDDLAGRIAARPSPLRWRTVRIPAIAEAGDVLGRAPGDELQSVRGRAAGHFLNYRANMSPYTFSGVYQQAPTAAEGNFFRRPAFRYWRPAEPWADGRARIDCEGQPVTLADTWRFATMDLAVSTKTGADWTVCAVWAVTPAGDLILLDRRRARIEDHDHFAMVNPLRTTWAFDTLYVEQQYIASTVIKDAQAAGIPVAGLRADTDKVTRAVPAAGRVHAGRVWFPAETSGCECGVCPVGVWLDEWCDELAAFPQAGSHDDQVDVLSYAARVVTHEWKPARNAPDRRRTQLSDHERALRIAAASATGRSTFNGQGREDLDIMNVPY